MLIQPAKKWRLSISNKNTQHIGIEMKYQNKIWNQISSRDQTTHGPKQTQGAPEETLEQAEATHTHIPKPHKNHPNTQKSSLLSATPQLSPLSQIISNKAFVVPKSIECLWCWTQRHHDHTIKIYHKKGRVWNTNLVLQGTSPRYNLPSHEATLDPPKLWSLYTILCLWSLTSSICTSKSGSQRLFWLRRAVRNKQLRPSAHGLIPLLQDSCDPYHLQGVNISRRS